MSDLLHSLSEQLKDEISYAPYEGKASSHIDIIRFIRALAEDHIKTYGQPLNKVISISVKAIYGTDNYDESSISNLTKRNINKETPDECLERLSTLSKEEYDFIKGREANKHNVSISTLDDELEKYRAR